jgi:hypothetical protein
MCLSYPLKVSWPHYSLPCGLLHSVPRRPPPHTHTLALQVRCLVDVPGEKLPEDLPAYLRATVAPQLPAELQPAFLTALEAEPIRSMQNKQLTSKPLHQPGMLWDSPWILASRGCAKHMYKTT